MGPDRIATISQEFDPISLDELNQRAALQTRADNKYFLSWPVFMAFAEALRKTHVMLDINGQRAFSYDTQYFDTPNLTSYWSHVQGRRKRFKCRSRRYVDSGLCFFELKLKGNRGETVKHKMAYGETECGQITPSAANFLHAYLCDDYGLLLTQPLRSTLRTSYQRATLVAQAFTERVTCDFNLEFARGGECEGLMAPDYMLVETKTEHGRGKADQLLWRLGMRPSPGSKYCLGLGLVQPEVRSNPFLRVRKRYFIRVGEQLAGPSPVRSVFTAPVPSATDTGRSTPVSLPGSEAVSY